MSGSSSSTNQFQCDQCPYIATRKSDQTKHKKQHKKKHLLPCGNCDFITFSASTLKKHMSRQHPVKRVLKKQVSQDSDMDLPVTLEPQRFRKTSGPSQCLIKKHEDHKLEQYMTKNLDASDMISKTQALKQDGSQKEHYFPQCSGMAYEDDELYLKKSVIANYTLLKTQTLKRQDGSQKENNDSLQCSPTEYDDLEQYFKENLTEYGTLSPTQTLEQVQSQENNLQCSIAEYDHHEIQRYLEEAMSTDDGLSTTQAEQDTSQKESYPLQCFAKEYDQELKQFLEENVDANANVALLTKQTSEQGGSQKENDSLRCCPLKYEDYELKQLLEEGFDANVAPSTKQTSEQNGSQKENGALQCSSLKYEYYELKQLLEEGFDANVAPSTRQTPEQNGSQKENGALQCSSLKYEDYELQQLLEEDNGSQKEDDPLRKYEIRELTRLLEKDLDANANAALSTKQASEQDGSQKENDSLPVRKRCKIQEDHDRSQKENYLFQCSEREYEDHELQQYLEEMDGALTLEQGRSQKENGPIQGSFMEFDDQELIRCLEEGMDTDGEVSKTETKPDVSQKENDAAQCSVGGYEDHKLEQHTKNFVPTMMEFSCKKCKYVTTNFVDFMHHVNSCNTEFDCLK